MEVFLLPLWGPQGFIRMLEPSSGTCVCDHVEYQPWLSRNWNPHITLVQYPMRQLTYNQILAVPPLHHERCNLKVNDFTYFIVQVAISIKVSYFLSCFDIFQNFLRVGEFKWTFLPQEKWQTPWVCPIPTGGGGDCRACRLVGHLVQRIRTKINKLLTRGSCTSVVRASDQC